VPLGDQLTVRVSRGSSLREIEDRADDLAAGVHGRAVRVEINESDASRGVVTLVRRDPLSNLEAVRSPIFGVREFSLWDPLPLGIDEQGAITEVLLPERSMLIGGEPGSGKSVALAAIVAAAALDPRAHLWLLDGKQVELNAWAGCADASVGPDLAQAIRVLERLQVIMEARYSNLPSTGGRKLQRSAEVGLHLVACDELALFLTMGDRKECQRFVDLMRDLVARGRAAGIIVVAATQKPGVDVIPSSLRDLLVFRLAFRCTTPQASDTVLGATRASEGYDASKIAPADPGVGYLLGEDGTPRRMRTFLLSDADIDDLARRATYVRRDAVA